MKKVFILFGPTGDLGKEAVKYFLDKNFDYYYYISRKQFEVPFHKNKYQIIITDDISNEDDVVQVFSKIEKESSNIYFLFSTIGGYFGGKSLWETEYKDWEKMLSMNLNTSFLIAKHFSKLIQDTKGGSICFTSAVSSFKNENGKIAYGLSKNALNYLVKSLAVEGKGIGLTANAVAPNIIDTPSNREWMKDSSKLVNPNTICETVYNFFIEHPKATGEIAQLMH